MYRNLKSKVNQVYHWTLAHKRQTVLVILSAMVLILVLNLIFGFRLRKDTLDIPEYIYESGETIQINYEQIQLGNTPDIIEVVSPSVENNFRSLSINLITTNIIIEDHQTGAIFETLKVNSALNEANQNLQRAPLFITYMYEGWTTGKRLDAFTHSISRQKYEVIIIEGGVRVIYHMGVHTPSLSWMPQRITETLYDELHAQTNASGKIALQNVYQRPSGANFYQIVSSIAQPFIDRIYSVWYEEYGLTFETLFELNRAFNIRNNFIEIPSFKIPVEYKLDQGDFIARVVLPEIKEESLSFNDEESLFIQDIDLLPYFFSTQNHSDAFMFVPDGSGAIVELSRPDFNYTRYTKGFYDARSLLSTHYTPYLDQESILMPVFGLAKENFGIFGIIESGAMQSLLQIRRASSNNALNAIYPTIIYRHKDAFSLSGVVIDMYSKPLNEIDYQVRYRLLEKTDDITYMNMVESYQDYLFGEKPKENYIPDIHINLIGAIKDRAFFIGIPYEKMIALTSFRDAKLIMESLSGYVNSYTYQGWSEGGMLGKPMTSLNLERALGSRRDFNNLLSYATSEDIRLNLDVPILHVYENSNGFHGQRHAAKLIGDYTRAFYPYDLSRMLMKESADLGTYYLMNPSYITSFVDQFLKQSTLGVTALELRDLGNTFTADFGRDGTTPSLVEGVINDALARLEHSYDLTLRRPFMHAIPYASSVSDLPYQSSVNYMFSYSIPFYQLILNGHMRYRLESTNTKGIKPSDLMFLSALASGSGLAYDLTYVNSSVTKSSSYFNYMYATSFDVWKDEIIAYSILLQDIYATLGTSIIKNHQTLASGLVLVTYLTDQKLLINMTHQTQTYLTHTVEPYQYQILGG